MRTVLNLIWFVFSGLWLWIGYVMAGIICCVLIVTIPWGIASFRMANYAVWPFGRSWSASRPPGCSVPRQRDLDDRRRLVAGADPHRHRSALCLTIIGIPLGVANFKLIPISLMPLGKEIVPPTPRAGEFSYGVLTKASIARSRSAREWAADIWVRIRAWPRGTTGNENART